MFRGSMDIRLVYIALHPLAATTHSDPTLHLKNASDSFGQTDGLTSANDTGPLCDGSVRELILQIAA